MKNTIRALAACAAIALAASASAEYAGLDVGAPALAGQTTTVSAGSAYDVAAAGTDIYASADQFHFAYRLQSGDFDLRVRVDSLSAVHEWSKAGLMARESMHPGSRHVSLFATPAGGYEFQYRATAGASVQKTDSAARVSYPNSWIRLKRAGNVFTAYTSSDGLNWTLAGSRSLALAPALFFGMATTSHDAAQSVLAQFRDLSTVVPSGFDVGAPALAGQTMVVSAGSDYDVTAAGSDIFGTADQFHFAHKLGSPSDTFSLQDGNFDVRVRVASFSGTQEWAKAGLMVRESLHPGSRQVSVLATPAAGFEFQYRAATGGSAQKLDSVARVSYPDTWVRLRRVGNQFTAYTGTDGVEWTHLGSTTLALPQSVLLGLAATSHLTTQAAVAQFRGHGKVDSSNDNKAPSAPGGLSTAGVSPTQINLAWSAATDNVGVVGYRVMRDGAQIATTSALAYTNAGLAPSTSYTYTVAAFDAAGNVSAGSTPASAVTQAPPDAAAPTTPAGLSANAISTSQIALAWSASTDNVGVASYRVLRAGVQVATTSALAYTDTGLAASTAYTYTVRAADAAGNVSEPSMPASATTQAPPDTAAPSVPAGLAAAAVSVSQINLSWTPSTDNVTVTGYKVLRGGVEIATAVTPAHADTGLAPATLYSYSVKAFDAAGNVSAGSTPVNATTQAPPDAVAPTAPAGLSATALSSTQIALAWSASTDNVAVVSYRVLRNGVQVGATSVLAYTDAGLAASTSYSYTVSAVDAAGNVSAPSTAATATTQALADTAAPSVPLGLGAIAVSVSQINLAWTASTDNVAVTGYKVLRGGVEIATTVTPAYADTGRAPATVYSYTVKAFDAAGNVSAPSAAATAVTLTPPDILAPSAPGAASAVAMSPSQIRLTWSASTDNVGVKGYNVLRNGVLVGGTSSLSYTDTGLAPSTPYTYTVTAADAAGNVSAPSSSAAATTQQGASGNAQSPLGTNLAAVADWSREWAFVDAFKTSRPWISGSASAWDDGRALATDADGWITSLQSGQLARTLLFWDLEGAYPAGTYTVLYDGQGTLQITGAASVTQSQPGRIVLQVNPSAGGIMLNVTATTPGNPVRNIRVLMPGGICEGDPYRHAADAAACADAGLYRSFETHHAQIVFHPKFLASVRAYRSLRYMDWGATNNSGQTAWSGRPKPSDARWSVKGVPVEVMVDLANRLGAHPWFTLPHRADNDYVAQYARLVEQALRPDLKAYVEYSNEVWNYQFAQADYARTQGLALGLSGEQYEAARRFYTKRSVEIFNLWSAEFEPARLVRVMGSQAANSWLSGELLDYQNARAVTDALAIAPYFGSHIQAGAASWTLDQLFADLQASMGGVIAWMNAQKVLAAARGVDLIAYEGGQHLVGHSGAENNAALNALLDAANRDPRMGALYRTYLDGWKATGGQLLVHYYNTGPFTKWGRWGALESLDQARSAAPKFDALQTFIEQNPASW